MPKTAINLFSVRDLDEPTLDILDRVDAASYDGVQFSGGIGEATPAEVREKLDETGLTPVAPHVGVGDLEDDAASVLDTYRDGIGCEDVVVPHIGHENFADAESVDAVAERLDALGERLAAEDVRLHYHNHDFEFTPLDDGTAFDRFLAQSSVGIELDVGWAAAGGDDPAALIERLDDRIEFVHMKDVRLADDTPVEIGTGDVDMAACAEAAASVGAGWLIYEHDIPDDPAASIETGAAFLAEL
jgi:sugar phosphate isomerase/epimerase